MAATSKVAKTTKTKKAKPPAPEDGLVVREQPLGKLLKGVFLISSATFGSLTPAKQTALLAEAGEAPIKFVDSFAEFLDKRALLEGLMKGKDISLQLEFLEIDFSEEERAAVKLFAKVREKIDALPLYPWSPQGDIDAAGKEITITSIEARNRPGYSASLPVLKRLWKLASAYWSGGKRPGAFRANFGGYSRSTLFQPDCVVIGCQTIPKAQLEYLAQNRGWAPMFCPK